MKQTSCASDTGRFIGLDVHKHYITIGGMNVQQEFVLRPRNVEIERFREWAVQNLRLNDRVVLEATTNTWDIYDMVAPLVAEVQVAHPAEVKQIANARVKTDKRDVERLIRLLVTGTVPKVWVPPDAVRQLRALLAYRWRLVKMGTMIQNRLHSLLHTHNLAAPEGKIHTAENLAWWQKLSLSPLEDLRLKQELELLQQIRVNIEAVEAELGRLSNREPWASQAVYLMQLPGVGIIVAMTALAAIGEISRFENPKKLVGYAGLGAGVHDSGETHRGKRITKYGRKELRWAMIEAAWQAIRSNPHWRAEYDRLCQRKPANQAIVAIARKLLVTIWYVLSQKEPYDRYSEDELAYKMLTWAWHIDETALNGLTRQQFAKYGLMRLGVGEQLTRIVRGKYPRRIAPMEEVLALRPELAKKP